MCHWLRSIVAYLGRICLITLSCPATHYLYIFISCTFLDSGWQYNDHLYYHQCLASEPMGVWEALGDGYSLSPLGVPLSSALLLTGSPFNFLGPPLFTHSLQALLWSILRFSSLSDHLLNNYQFPGLLPGVESYRFFWNPLLPGVF